MPNSEKWTEQELTEAAMQLLDVFGSERKGDPKTFISDVVAGWNIDLEMRAAIELACQRNRLKYTLEEVDRLAEAGLCQMSTGGKHGFLNDIRRAIAESGVQGGLTEHE